MGRKGEMSFPNIRFFLPMVPYPTQKNMKNATENQKMPQAQKLRGFITILAILLWIPLMFSLPKILNFLFKKSDNQELVLTKPVFPRPALDPSSIPTSRRESNATGFPIASIVQGDFKRFDRSGDGLIDLRKERSYKILNEKQKREIWAIGNYLDRADEYGNRDGFASKEEAIAFLKQYDVTYDGVIGTGAGGFEFERMKRDGVSFDGLYSVK
jgi:hypothetical protein